MSVLKIVVISLMILCSVLFIPCISSYGNKEKSLAFHKEMPNSTSIKLLNFKNLITVATGLLYLLAVLGLFLRLQPLVILGVIGSSAFVLFYFFELTLWAFTFPLVWVGFLLFGLPNLFIGICNVIFLIKIDN